MDTFIHCNLHALVNNLHAHMLNHCFFSDHIPPISEVISGDTKIVTEFKRNEEGKLLKVVLSSFSRNNYDTEIQWFAFIAFALVLLYVCYVIG